MDTLDIFPAKILQCIKRRQQNKRKCFIVNRAAILLNTDNFNLTLTMKCKEKIRSFKTPFDLMNLNWALPLINITYSKCHSLVNFICNKLRATQKFLFLFREEQMKCYYRSRPMHDIRPFEIIDFIWKKK